MTGSPKIYLAGPDVFRVDALAIAAALKEACARRGLEGRFPLDCEIAFPSGALPADKGALIFQANVNLLSGCDAVVANLSPWRGGGADNGTCWEQGFAYARGIPVFGYSADLRDYKHRVEHRPAGERLVDAEGMTVEDFGLFDNLMIACSAQDCVASAEVAIEMAAAHFRREGRIQ